MSDHQILTSRCALTLRPLDLPEAVNGRFKSKDHALGFLLSQICKPIEKKRLLFPWEMFLRRDNEKG